MKYFEITFGQYPSSPKTYLPRICIKGRREPSRTEANEFCMMDMEMIGADYVAKIKRITHAQAKEDYNCEDEENWPVFADEEDWD